MVNSGIMVAKIGEQSSSIVMHPPVLFWIFGMEPAFQELPEQVMVSVGRTAVSALLEEEPQVFDLVYYRLSVGYIEQVGTLGGCKISQNRTFQQERFEGIGKTIEDFQG